MAVLSTARVFAAAALWRLGVTSAGRGIVEAAAGDDEDTSTVAGMLLTNAGDRSVPLIGEAVAAGGASLVLVDVLASIGSESALGELRKLAIEAGGDIATEADAAVRRLEQRRRS